jgi:hypothetical protein
MLGRPPYATELAEALGDADVAATRGRIHRLAALGLLRIVSAPKPMHPIAVRLTATAKVALGTPVVAYGAWSVPMSDDVWAMGDSVRVGSGLAHALLDHGVVLISPFLVPVPWTVGQASASQVATACDGIVVCRDRCLIGRSDVHAARVAGLPCSFVSGVDEVGSVPRGGMWLPPYLEPALASQRSA